MRVECAGDFGGLPVKMFGTLCANPSAWTARGPESRAGLAHPLQETGP